MSLQGALKLRESRAELQEQPQGNNSRPWTTRELATLEALASLGAGAVAVALGRSVTSVRKMAHVRRLSLRRPGSRDGLFLGQPRNMSLVDVKRLGLKVDGWVRMRERVITNDVDLERLEEIAGREAALARGVPLCPSCTTNPQEVAQTGLCRDCHIRKLAEAHRLEETSAAQRELWAERQAKVRRRRREALEELEGAGGAQ